MSKEWIEEMGLIWDRRKYLIQLNPFYYLDNPFKTYELKN